MSSSLANWKHIIAKMSLKPRDNWLCTVYRLFFVIHCIFLWLHLIRMFQCMCHVPTNVACQMMYKRLCSVHLNPDIATDDKKTLNCCLQQHTLCISDLSLYEYAMHTVTVCIEPFRCCNQTYFIYLFVSHGNKCMNTLLIAHPDERHTHMHTKTTIEMSWDQMRNETKPNWIVSFNFKFRKWVSKDDEPNCVRRRQRKSHLVWLLAQNYSI